MHKLIIIVISLITSPTAFSGQICEDAAEYAFRGYDDAHWDVPLSNRIDSIKSRYTDLKYQKFIIAMVFYGRDLYKVNQSLEISGVSKLAKEACFKALNE